jgi:hypothetical protein
VNFNNLIAIVGMVLAIFAIFGLLGGSYITRLIRRWSNKTKDYLNIFYEKDLYNAVRAYSEGGIANVEVARWKAHLRFLGGLGLLWLPQVRKELAVIHEEKEEKFKQSVAIRFNWRKPSDAELSLRAWTVWMMNEQGQRCAIVPDLLGYQLKDPARQRRLFTDWDGVCAVVVAPDGMPQYTLTRDRVLRETA